MIACMSGSPLFTKQLPFRHRETEIVLGALLDLQVRLGHVTSIEHPLLPLILRESDDRSEGVPDRSSLVLVEVEIRQPTTTFRDEFDDLGADDLLSWNRVPKQDSFDGGEAEGVACDEEVKVDLVRRRDGRMQGILLHGESLLDIMGVRCVRHFHR